MKYKKSILMYLQKENREMKDSIYLIIVFSCFLWAGIASLVSWYILKHHYKKKEHCDECDDMREVWEMKCGVRGGWDYKIPCPKCRS